MRWFLYSLGSITLLAFIAAFDANADADAGGDAARGEQLYGRCAGCHSLDENRIGPLHRGVYGRAAGSVADYAYSDALRASAVVWDDATLDAWLTDPQAFIPGQKMFFRLANPADRADIIAYLRQISGQ